MLLSLIVTLISYANLFQVTVLLIVNMLLPLSVTLISYANFFQVTVLLAIIVRGGR